MQALQSGEQAIAAVAAADADGTANGEGQVGGRELRTAAAVHAHALATATAALAESAPAAVRTDPAVLRAVLLPLLQTAASGPALVAAEAAAAVSALCTCAALRSSDSCMCTCMRTLTRRLWLSPASMPRRVSGLRCLGSLLRSARLLCPRPVGGPRPGRACLKLRRVGDEGGRCMQAWGTPGGLSW